MSDVQEMLQVQDDNVRKWGTQLLFLQGPNDPVPESFFTASHEPVLPAGALQLGYVTTDGASQEDSISNEGTSMLQSLEPVRYDLTGIEKSFTVAFGEDNAFVQAIWHGVPFEDFPADPYGSWRYDDGEISQYPWYRLGCIMQDGVGELARYRYEYGYRVTLTAKESRTMNRTDPETYGFTFGLTKDKVLKKSYTREQDGPGYHVTAPAGGTGA